MCTDAGFHADQAWRHVGKASLYLATGPLLTQHNGTTLIVAHDVERVLADIDANHGDCCVVSGAWRAPCLRRPWPASIAGGAGARPDHPISGPVKNVQPGLPLGRRMALGYGIAETKVWERSMTGSQSISEHWGSGDVYARILKAMEAASVSLDAVTIEQLAPLDHFHARGFPATIELADALPVQASHHIVDIGCGIGGPARYFAKRFGCRVSGVDITPSFVVAANKLTELLKMEGQVEIVSGDGQHLPYSDATFDGGYTQHVTMNIADRAQFFNEAFRVLKPGAFFALTEHGLGPAGSPLYPVPWSEDGTGSYLVRPEDTVVYLKEAGFVDIKVEDTGAKYLDAYRRAIELADQGTLPPLGVHVLVGQSAAAKTRNAARNIEDRRTHPIQVVCTKPH
jgi:SAM-dependent methyltransferase